MDSAPRSAPLWQLPEAHTRAIAELGARRAVARGAIVIHEGERGDSFFVILEGKVRVYLADEGGKEILLNQHGPGEHFGEMMLDGGPRSATVVAAERCVFSVVSREQLREYLARHPDCAHALILLLMARVRGLTNTVGNLALLDVYGRVAKLLWTMSRVVDGVRQVDYMTQQEVASRVGASREMVSRILKDLVAGGYIRSEERVRFVVLATPPTSW
jgi:CRP/FNR family cyclic AMP-dependent transcriptional regulator